MHRLYGRTVNIPNSTAPLPAKSTKAKVKAPQKRRDLFAPLADSQEDRDYPTANTAIASEGEFAECLQSQDRGANRASQRSSSVTGGSLGDDGAVLLQRASRSKKHSIGSFSRLEEDLEKVPERRGMIIDLLV